VDAEELFEEAILSTIRWELVKVRILAKFPQT
jgi:hypothetical protein